MPDPTKVVALRAAERRVHRRAVPHHGGRWSADKPEKEKAGAGAGVPGGGDMDFESPTKFLQLRFENLSGTPNDVGSSNAHRGRFRLAGAALGIPEPERCHDEACPLISTPPTGRATPSHRHRLPTARPRGAARSSSLVLLLSIAAAIAGLVLLWPDKVSGSGLGGQIVNGRVVSTKLDCTNGCIKVVDVEVTSGPRRGTSTTLTFQPGATGPSCRGRRADPACIAPARGAGAVYEFADINRRTPDAPAGRAVRTGRSRGGAGCAG